MFSAYRSSIAPRELRLRAPAAYVATYLGFVAGAALLAGASVGAGRVVFFLFCCFGGGPARGVREGRGCMVPLLLLRPAAARTGAGRGGGGM